jgi:hypothetical protein
MLGKNMAISTDFTICAPMNNGNRSFFSPKARNPSPKPVRKELFPEPSETQTQKSKKYSKPVQKEPRLKTKRHL